MVSPRSTSGPGCPATPATPAPSRPDAVDGLDLGDLATRLGVHVAAPVAAPAGRPAPTAPGPRVTGVTLDSRAVRPGDLYAALPGTRTHGARFAGQAAARGAVGVLTDPDGAAAASGAGLPALVVPDPRAVLGALSARVYGDPAADLVLLGVTGTNGKTTTTCLLASALGALGARTGLVGTVGNRIDGAPLPSARTTPEAPDLHALLALMRERGVTVCALEVSSHAVALHRVDGLVLDVAAFTNLSQDHLDFHPTMEDYFAAKAALFTPGRARRGVVVVDDAWGRRLAAQAAATGLPVTTVSSAGRPADWAVVPASVRAREDGRPGSAFTLTGPDGDVALASPLPGTFNVANTALALAVLVTAGTPVDRAAAALAGAPGVPGRMEVVPGPPGAPCGVVDYAHSPDAVAAALAALRPTTPGRLVVVLGAGGDRDATKRPAMGAAAARGADVVLVTDDNPRSEDPAAVRAAVLAGARAVVAAVVGEVAGADGRPDGLPDVREVPGRREAVRAAVAAARASGPGATVLVAGKGHEQGQEVAGVVHPFDDRVVLAQVLAECVPAPAGGAR